MSKHSIASSSSSSPISTKNSLYDSDCLHCLPCKIEGDIKFSNNNINNDVSNSKEMMEKHFKIDNCPDSNKIESSFRGRKIVGDCSTLIGIILEKFI